MSLRRHGAVLLVAALLFAPLVALAHQSTAQHSVCPEHGELIHGRQMAASWVGPTAQVRGVPGEPDDDHDICELAVASHERSQPPAAAPAVASPPAAGRQSAPQPGRSAGRSLALYRLAPKTSPPA